jgi:thiamine-monophosphate kinase
MAAPLSEFEMIARLFAPIAGEGALGLIDDAAMFQPCPGYDLVLSVDALVENVHFFAQDPPGSIARKTLRVNLSDLAAKGARPRGFLLSLGRGPRQDDDWMAEFAAGLAADSRACAMPLLGGDTVRTNQAFFSVTVFGEVPAGRMVKRQGGATGDFLYVSGTIGDAALGLQLRLRPDAAWAVALLPAHRDFLLDRYLQPQPRLVLAEALHIHASAGMDISDGLVGDANKLAVHLGHRVEIEAVPLSPAARAAIALDPALLETILTGGDDYEILAAIPPARVSDFEAACRVANVPVTRIGVLSGAGDAKIWLDPTGKQAHFSQNSYRHF